MKRTHSSKTTANRLTLSATIAVGLLSVLTWTGDLAAQGQTTEHKIVPSNVAPGHYSGNAVAVRGRIAVVGAFGADVSVTDSGAVYVFEFDGNNWSQTAKLTASDGGLTDQLGSAVAVDDRGTIVVGADGKASARGAAYVFEKTGGAWVQTAKVVASDGQTGDHFGFSVTVHGDTMIVGAWGRSGVSGAAYIFERSTSGWQQTAILVASDAAQVDYFGYTVSVEGDIALIGSPADDDRGTNSGSAYIFTRSNGIWTQTVKLLAGDGAASDFLARTGSISNGTVVLGARDNDDLGSSSGSAYVFQVQNGAWTQTAKLLPNDGRANDIFGHAVSISGDRIVVGAKWRDDTAPTSGAAYVFERGPLGWKQTARLNASDARSGDSFGQSVAIDGRVTLVGSWRAAGTRGAAYIYQEPSQVDAILSTVTTDDPAISAYGGTTRVQVTPKKSDGTVVGAGLIVQVSATGGRLIGTVSDNGDGTYTQVLEGAPGLGQIVVSAIADGVALVDTATVAMLAVSGDTSTVTVNPSQVTVGQSATVIVTPKTTTGANVGTGQIVTIGTTLGNLVASVKDNGDGTYSQQLDATDFGTADITAVVNGTSLIDGATLIVLPQILGRVVGIRDDGSTVFYRTIQHAVSRSESDELVKIVVAPGHFDEVVRIQDIDGLHLQGMPSRGLTTIRGFRIKKSRDITIEGFDIDATDSRHNGITLRRSVGVVVRHTIVHGARGAGIVVGRRCVDVLIDQCLVQNNDREGIHVRHDTSALRILRCIVRGNGSAGIFVDRLAELRIQGCEIVDNGGSDRRGRGTGYGIYLERMHGKKKRKLNPELVTLIRNTVQGNRGKVVRGSSDANFGNYDQFIDATDDQAPFNR